MDKVIRTMNERWNDLSFRDKSALASAWIAFCAGWLITVAGFASPPIGVITDGVLWILGQSLIYAASCFGIVNYFHTSLKKNKKEIASFITEQLANLTDKSVDEDKIEKNLV